MIKKIAILPGDGIGPEVIKQATKVLQAIAEVHGHQFELIEAMIGATAIDHSGNPFPEETEGICKNADAILFGAIGHPKYDNDPNVRVRPEQGLLAMRRKLGLYANIRPIKSYKAMLQASPLKEEVIGGTDFIVFRELTGGIYFGQPRGRSEDGNTAFDTCQYSKDEILKIARLAFEAARHRQKKLTLVDKANVLATSRLWREVVQGLAQEFPDITLDCMFVDNAAMKIIQRPGDFDVVLTENMFGDILTDEASVISGSLGMSPSASIGEQQNLYEPIHGSYPEAAGKNLANPFGAILSVAMLLEYSFGMKVEAKRVEDAVNQAIDEGVVTEDIDKETAHTTEEVGDHVAAYILQPATA